MNEAGEELKQNMISPGRDCTEANDIGNSATQRMKRNMDTNVGRAV